MDNADGVGQARIARRLNGLEIVERAENVVVPPRREGEAKEHRLDDFSRAMRAKQPMHEEEFPAPSLRLAHGPHFASTVQLIESQAFEGADRRVDGGVGGATSPPA